MSRAFLKQTHPEIEASDRMLYADEEAIASALAYINTRCGANLDVHWVEPHADGHPVRWLRSATGEQPVAIIRFGNHFEALRSIADDSRSSSEQGHEYIGFAQRFGIHEGSSEDFSLTSNWDLSFELHGSQHGSQHGGQYDSQRHATPFSTSSGGHHDHQYQPRRRRV